MFSTNIQLKKSKNNPQGNITISGVMVFFNSKCEGGFLPTAL